MVKNNPGEPYSRISSEEALEMQKNGDSTVIDVRNEDEYEAGHVKDAIWIPVDEIVQRMEELPKDGNLLFICAVGARSGLAAEYASSLGIDSSTISGLDTSTSIIPISIRYFIALVNSESGILLSDHQPAVFLTQSGMILSGPGIPGSVEGM